MSMTTANPIDTNGDNEISRKELKEWQNKTTAEKIADPDFERMATNWGYAAGYLSQTPELAQLLFDILESGVTDGNIIESRIANSPWGLKYAADYVEADKVRKGSPDVWAAQVGLAAKKIMDQANEMGASITEDQALDYAEKWLLTTSGDKTDPNFVEYNQEWLDRTLAGAIDFTKTKTINGVQIYDLSGSAENQAQALYETAYQYGMDTSMTNDAFTGWFENAVKRLVSKETTVEDLDDEIVNNAISRFPGLAQQLQRGQTLRQAADPYLKAISEVLEFDPGTLSFDDNLVQQVLNSVDESGAFKPMSLYDAKLAARRDDRWQYTSTAKTEYTDLASTILKDFGFLG